jgi:hypothetical protein
LNSQSDSHSLRLTHLEHAIHHADCAVSAGFDDVRVGAQRESHVTVRKNLGHVSDRHALREQDGRARMPERMKRQARQVLSAAVLTLLIDNFRMLAVWVPAPLVVNGARKAQALSLRLATAGRSTGAT